MKVSRVISVLVLASVASPLHAQSSSMLKSVSKYLPSLTEIGFVTGAINCYIQTATLVRAVNKEIVLAKSMSKRLDDLKGQTEQMVGQFGSLSKIDPYNMDSWASWLNRAEGLVTEETNDFVDILFNSVLKTLDDRMTVGFYANVKKGLSYDVSQGQVKQVLSAYYMDREYEGNREKLRTIALNSKRLELLAKQGELSGVSLQLLRTRDPDLRVGLEKKSGDLQKEISQLEDEVRNPAVGGTSTDRQISFLMDLAQNLAQEITKGGDQLEKHQKDLVSLNQEWELASKDKLPKGKNRTVLNAPVKMERDIYSSTNPDKVPVPSNDVDRPKKQNTSETSSPTNLSDLLHLQNKIELKRLEIMENLFAMDLNLAQARAALLALQAYKSEDRRNQRTNVSFESENLETALRR